MQHRLQPVAALICAAFIAAPVLAQAQETIERTKPTDNGLSCAQIADERNAMDTVIGQAKEAQSSGQTTAVAGQTGAVAAEVASRTGLFGSIGGLAGQLFGSAAAKTAANVATDQGKQTAANAAERERQANARKEQLAQLSLAKNCAPGAGQTASAAINTPAVAAAPAAPAPAAAAAPAAPAASANAAPTFAAPVLGVVNGKYLKGVKRVAVASFTVQFVEAQIGEVKASARLGSAGGVTLTEVKSRVLGVDFSEVFQRERMQETTNGLYRDLLAELAASGLEVVPPEKLQASQAYKKFASQGPETPRVEDAEAQKGSGQGAIRSVFMTPPGVPLVIKGSSGGQDIDYLTKYDSFLGANAGDFTLTFSGRLSLYSTNWLYYEKDVQKDLDTATLHVRVFVPLAVIEVDSGMNWTKAKIVPGALLGNRFTRMTVGVNSDYTYIFLKEDLQLPGVISYTVEETPHSNPVRAMVGEKERKYPSTMNVPRYWSDVPAASRHVFKAFTKALVDGQKGP